ncbi:MAG: glycosyltransferase family 4 protein [Eubacterium sp.]|nr:glycosyltransferase family 4 protein [Eubacterium sp.]
MEKQENRKTKQKESRRKRILYIEHYAGSPTMGMEFRPYYLAREWVRMGYRVDIVAADYSHLRAVNPKIEHDFQCTMEDGIRYHWIHTREYYGNGAARAITMAQFLSKLWGAAGRIAEKYRPDVIITSSTYPLDTFVGQRIRKKTKKQKKHDVTLIHEVHDMWPATLIEVGGMSKHHPFTVAMQIGENSAYKRSDAVVSLPPLTEPYMKEHGLKDGKWYHVPNGIVEAEWQDPEPVPEEHRAVLEELRRRGRFIVGYFGGHAISNALDGLLDAAACTEKRESRASYVLVGDGVEKDRLVKRAKEMGLKEVYFLPKVPKKSIPSLVQWFDCSYVGAMNSSLYRFGLCMNKIFDSMMAGKPILCAITTPDDIVTRNGAGVMVPSDAPEEIDRVVAEWEQLPEKELQKMGDAGHRAALEKYTYRKLAEDFAKLFS